MQVSKYTLKLRNSSRGFVTFISLQALLREEIRCALRQIPLATRNISVKDSAIPFTIRQQRNLIHYRSAIALILASKASINATQIAQQLVTILQQQVNLGFIQIRWICSGWIEFTVTEEAIPQWLQQCLTRLPALPLSFPSTVTPLSFPQYIHHRCWRLLQLGAEANLISLTDNISNWQNYSFAGKNILQTEDWQFIYQLMKTIDHLENATSAQKITKLTNHLSEAFIRFHRYCRIFDRQQNNFPEIAIIRLHFIAITYGILQHLTQILSHD